MGFDRNLVHVILTLISDLKAELKMYTPTMSILTDGADRLQNTDVFTIATLEHRP